MSEFCSPMVLRERLAPESAKLSIKCNMTVSEGKAGKLSDLNIVLEVSFEH